VTNSREPTLSEFLSDPVTRAIMQRTVLVHESSRKCCATSLVYVPGLRWPAAFGSLRCPLCPKDKNSSRNQRTPRPSAPV